MTNQSIDGNNNIQVAGDINYFNIQNIPNLALFYPKHIDVILTNLSEYFDTRIDVEYKQPSDKDLDLDYLEKNKKNKLNKLSESYFKSIVNNHLSYFIHIDEFLKSAIGKRQRKLYEKIKVLLNQRIEVLRPNYEYFEQVLERIMSELFSQREESLEGYEVEVVIFINYMYWNCDIGDKNA